MSSPKKQKTTSTSTTASSTTSSIRHNGSSIDRTGPPSLTKTNPTPFTPFTFVQLADTQFGLGESIVSAIRSKKLDQMTLEPALQLFVETHLSKNKDHDEDTTKINQTSTSSTPSSSPSSPDNNNSQYEFLYQQELKQSRKTVNIINAMIPKPSFACVCGDLVNAYPKDQKGRTGQERQVSDFKEIYGNINVDIPLICVCGNHDIGDRPNSISIDLYRSRFGDDYFTFKVNNVKFIVLNTQLYKDGQDVPGHVEQQSKWLTQELLKSKCLMGTEEYERLIIFSHISPFIEDANEEDGYFNLEKNIRLKLLNDISNAKGTHW